MDKKAVLLMILCTIFTSTAALLNKKGATLITDSYLSIINPFIILGITLLIFSSGILILALKEGDVSKTQPIIATNYMWVTFLSAIFFNEPLTLTKVVASIIIVLGVTLVVQK